MEEELKKELTEIKGMLSMLNEEVLHNRAYISILLSELEQTQVRKITPCNRAAYSARQQQKIETEIEQKFNSLKARSKFQK